MQLQRPELGLLLLGLCYSNPKIVLIKMFQKNDSFVLVVSLAKWTSSPLPRVVFCICICYTCSQVYTVILEGPRGYLEDSRSFNGDPPQSQSRFPGHYIRLNRVSTEEGCIAGRFLLTKPLGLNPNLIELNELKTRVSFFLKLDNGKYCP